MKTLNSLSSNYLLALLISFLMPGAHTWADSVAGINGDIEITPLVHSSVQLEYEGFVVQVDPWAPIDTVSYTHLTLPTKA